MKKALNLFTIALILNSCLSNKNHFEPSNLLMEGKKRNSLIENRIPKYGLGNQDGCVVEKQISMDIEILNKKRVVGTLIDSKTKEPILFGMLKLVFKNSETLKVNADIHGRFDIEFSDELIKIQAEYIGYRTLNVDLKELK